MVEAANDDHVLTDPDDIEDAKHAAERARVVAASKEYARRPDLLDLALATCLELRREQGELDQAARTLPDEPPAARELRRRRMRLILDRLAVTDRNLSAMTEAMDNATKAKFDEGMDKLPLPRDLVAQE